MPLLQLTFLAITAMVCLAAVRLARLRRGWTPMPEGPGRLFFLTAFVLVPPIAVGIMAHPSSVNLAWVELVPYYLAVLGVVVVAMNSLAGLVSRVAHGPASRIIRLALAGTDLDIHEMPTNPPMTAGLSELVATVREANAAFPRGPAFPNEPERAGFRGSWDALDRATRSLERQIDADKSMGFGAAMSAVDLADDARSRLSVLRQIATRNGQSWASL